MDVDPLAAVATRLAVEANELALEVTTSDRVGDRLEGIDVLVAVDVWYEPGGRSRSSRGAATARTDRH